MNVETTEVTKLRITEIPCLDPITVILEDLGPRQGKIIVECFGQSWSAYWGGMGDRTIAEFFCSCNADYIAGNFGNHSSRVIDYDAIGSSVRKNILELRKDKELKDFEAREFWDDAGCIGDSVSMTDNRAMLQEVLGDDWHMSLPMMPCPDYDYLCRIIRAVQEGLKAGPDQVLQQEKVA